VGGRTRINLLGHGKQDHVGRPSWGPCRVIENTAGGQKGSNVGALTEFNRNKGGLRATKKGPVQIVGGQIKIERNIIAEVTREEGVRI